MAYFLAGRCVARGCVSLCRAAKPFLVGKLITGLGAQQSSCGLSVFCFVWRRLGVRASIAAVDISDRHATPAHVYRVFPSALTPHGQILLPFAYEGQQPAVIPFEGPWTASGIVRALADQVPAAASALDFTQVCHARCFFPSISSNT